MTLTVGMVTETHGGWTRNLLQGLRRCEVVWQMHDKIVPIVVNCPVEFSSQQSRSLGKAFFPDYRIRLNNALLRLDEMQYAETFFHEVAHIAAAIRGREHWGHGWSWGCAMFAFGYEPNKYHSVSHSDIMAAKAPGTVHIADPDAALAFFKK